MCRESRIQVGRDEQASLVFSQISESFRDLLVIDMHIETTEDSSHFWVSGYR